MTYDEYWAQDPNNCGGCETCFRMFGEPPLKPEGWGQPKPLHFTHRRMVRARARYNRARRSRAYVGSRWMARFDAEPAEMQENLYLHWGRR